MTPVERAEADILKLTLERNRQRALSDMHADRADRLDERIDKAKAFVEMDAEYRQDNTPKAILQTIADSSPQAAKAVNDALDKVEAAPNGDEWNPAPQPPKEPWFPVPQFRPMENPPGG